VLWTDAVKGTPLAQGGPCASGATLQCAVQTTFPEGLHQNRRWTALCPCRAHLCLQAPTVTQAGSRLPEFPATPLPAPILVQTRALLLMK
jgi:hypothetical protein